MPASKNIKRTIRKGSFGAQATIATATRKSHSKDPGTRVGIIQDWRAASGNSGKTSTQRGNVLRDGR